MSLKSCPLALSLVLLLAATKALSQDAGVAAEPGPSLAPSAFSTLPFAASCSQPSPHVNRAIGIDSAGNIFIVALCPAPGGTIQLTTSTDAGASWAPPVDVATGADAMVVEGGTLPGHAIIAWAASGDVFARTTPDFGASFSPVSTIITGRMVAPGNGLGVLAEGTSYHIMAAELTFPTIVLTRRSLDRGATWLPGVDVPIPYVFGDLVHDAGTGNIELVADDPFLHRSTSIDNGASYSPAAPLAPSCCLLFSDWAMACRGLLYATGQGGGAERIWRWDMSTGPASPEQVNTLPVTIPRSRSVDGDDLGNGFTTGTEESTGRILLHRWGASMPTVDGPFTVTDSGRNAHVRACGMDTAYVTFFDSTTGRLEFERFCFSRACCAPGTNCAQPPVEPTCDAGGPYVAPCAGDFTSIQLDGSGSTDPGGLTLAHAWTTDCPGAAFDDAASPAPSLLIDSGSPCPLTCNVALSVSNGVASSDCASTVTISDVLPPRVTEGALAPCHASEAAAEASAMSATAAIDACDQSLAFSASTAGTCAASITVTVTDACGNSASVAYPAVIDGMPPTVTAGTIAACHATVAAAEAAALAATAVADNCPGDVTVIASTVGTCDAQVTVTATDSCGNSASVMYPTRIDAEAPVVSPSRPMLACLWPPNHRLVEISAAEIAPVLTDDCPGPLTWIIVGCVSNQPDNGLGDGNTVDDCTVAPDGQSIRVRAERQGGQPAGRSHAVMVVATDDCGNASDATPAGVVHVPHDFAPGERCPG